MAPRINRRTAVTIASVLYLLALTTLAAYALHQTHAHNLPIPNILTALTVALPPLAGLALETSISLSAGLAAKNQLSRSHIFQIVTSLLLVYETVIATLAGSRIYPIGGLECQLRERWQQMFRAKNADRVRAIQDAFQCCGFGGVKDMAFPFPDASHGGDACVVRYERTTRCLEPWREQERRVAVMLLVVPLAVFAWKVLLFAVPTPGGRSWLPSAVKLPGDGGQRGEPRMLQYRDVEGDVGSEDDSVVGETRRLNNDAALASHVEAGRVHPSALRNEWTRDDE